MKPISESLDATRRVYGPSGNLISSASQPFSHRLVSPAAMNPGNHRDPTNWAYEVYSEEYQNGIIGDLWPDQSVYQTRIGPTINNTLDSARIHLADDRRSEAYNTALERLNRQVRGKLDLSIDLVQAGKTAKMLDTTGGIMASVRRLDSAGLSVARLPLAIGKEVANRYLEWKYGWQPLLSDVYDGADEAVRYVLNKIQDVKATATIHDPQLSVQRLSVESGDLYSIPVEMAGKSSVAISLSFDTEGHDVDRWTSLNPVSIAWEALPYSFVADWFYDVGSYLRNLETSLLYRNSFRTGYVSELYVSSGQYDWKQLVKVWNGWFDFKLKSSRKAIRFNRSILTAYPLPRPPSFRTELSASRLLSAAALLSQFLGKGKKTTNDPPVRFTQNRFAGESFHEARASRLLLDHGLVR